MYSKPSETKLNHTRDIIIRVAIIAVAVILLVVGNRIAVRNLDLAQRDENAITERARVVAVINEGEYDDEFGSWRTLIFEARITHGGRRGETVIVQQSIDMHYDDESTLVAVGDRVIIGVLSPPDPQFDDPDMPLEWHFYAHQRINGILVLGGIFALLLLLFGRMKGLNALVSLALTVAIIFMVFIPAILSGGHVYVWTVLVCLYVIVFGLLIIHGIGRKSLAAIAGCLGGVVVAGLLVLLMSGALRLTGTGTDDAMHLQWMNIDLRAIIFAGIVIGAVGAIMDVAVSIASSLWELKENAPEMGARSLFKSGINIGRDVMGSMTNTLVLAYIGSSLAVILIIVANAASYLELFNLEMIVVELLQALIGSLGILLTMPLTAAICAVIYGRDSE
ncbi:MAG: YibE/F family protein [Oscillospiraceae bacterium]|nr:YibE/F family protein [Oscillospiraceae bacterium]